MEAIGSSLMFIILFIGIVLFFIKKARVLGGIFILGSLLFMYVLPFISFRNYKSGIVGDYINKAGKIISIDKDYEYIIKENGNEVSCGKVEFSNIDSYSFYLDNASQFQSNGNNEIVRIVKELDQSDIYKKVEK